MRFSFLEAASDSAMAIADRLSSNMTVFSLSRIFNSLKSFVIHSNSQMQSAKAWHSDSVDDRAMVLCLRVLQDAVAPYFWITYAEAECRSL